MKNVRLFAGLFYGLSAAEPMVLVGLTMYKVANLKEFDNFGYGKPDRDAVPVIACVSVDAFVLDSVTSAERGKRSWGSTECFLVPTSHLKFRPGCEPVGRLDSCLCEWVVTDTEGDNHIVPAFSADEALTAEVDMVAIDQSVRPERFERFGDKFWHLAFSEGQRSLRTGYGVAPSAEKMIKMLHCCLKELTLMGVTPVSEDNICPPTFDGHD